MHGVNLIPPAYFQSQSRNQRLQAWGLIMGAALFYASVVVIANLIVDLLCAAVDPRIRYE